MHVADLCYNSYSGSGYERQRSVVLSVACTFNKLIGRPEAANRDSYHYNEQIFNKSIPLSPNHLHREGAGNPPLPGTLSLRVEEGARL